MNMPLGAVPGLETTFSAPSKAVSKDSWSAEQCFFTCRGQRTTSGALLYYSQPSYFETGTLTKLEAARKPNTFLSLPSTVLALQTSMQPHLALYGFQSSKLRSSCLLSMHSYPLSHLPSLVYVLSSQVARWTASTFWLL